VFDRTSEEHEPGKSEVPAARRVAAVLARLRRAQSARRFGVSEVRR
jgi:hypothetical protein